MHFGEHWRDAFCVWVDEGMAPLARVEVDYEEGEWAAERLLGRMTHCTDILPRDVCLQLDIRPGSTYASAAQRLLRERPPADPVEAASGELRAGLGHAERAMNLLAIERRRPAA